MFFNIYNISYIGSLYNQILSELCVLCGSILRTDMDWQTKRDSFNHQLLPELVQDLWDGDPNSLQLVGQAYNIVYRFEANGDGYYLRIGHEILHPLNKVHHVMHFLRFLSDNHVPLGHPIASVHDNYIEVLEDGYYASAQTEAPGAEIGLDHVDLSVYEAWGKSLGQLHAVSRRYQPSSEIDYEFPTVQRFWKNIEPTVKVSSPELQAIYVDLTDYMEQLPKYDYGLIHGDYRPGNVIWDGSTARTVDFDEPNYNWYIADISRALLEFYDKPLEQRQSFRKLFMQGYLSENPIDDFWVSQLPKFGQIRGMLMHMWTVQEGSDNDGALHWALNRYEW